MSFFKKNKKESSSCCCSGSCEPTPEVEEKVYNEKGEEMAMCDCGSMCSVSDIEAAKKEKEKKSSSCCGSIDSESIKNAAEEKEKGASVKVLGSGCKKCNDLEKATKEALINLGMDTSIDHVTDFAAIAAYGVMTTPALVVDGKVVSYGKVLKVNEVESILKEVRK